jgi:hypothetical protein
MGFTISFPGKRFRSDNLNQALLLPPSLHDWLSSISDTTLWLCLREPWRFQAVWSRDRV